MAVTDNREGCLGRRGGEETCSGKCVRRTIQTNCFWTTKTKKTNEPIKISHVTAELAPLAKVGGLGDVTQGLGRAMKMQGHDVQVILPFYQSLDANEIFNLKHVMDFDVPKGMKWDGEDIVSMMKTSCVFWEYLRM